MDSEFRSRTSNGDVKMEMESYGSRVPPSSSSSSSAGPHGLRCYSTSHVGGSAGLPRETKPKGKSSSGSKGGWILSDPVFQRKKRLAGYKALALEGEMKGSLRRSFRWIKDVVGARW